MPKVSVILPVYNGEKYLIQCLDSLVNQTLKDIEIICIDDCSTDSSLEILKEYSEKYGMRIITSEQNQGQGISRNIGIDNAKSNYIMFIDNDDWYEPTACEEAYNQIVKNKNDFVIFNINHYWEKTGISKVRYDRLIPFQKVINNPDIKPYELHENIFVSGFIWCQIYNKNFLDKNNIRFGTEKLAEDVPFFVKAMVSAESISILNKPLYNYRRHMESCSNTGTYLWEYLFKSREKSYKIVLESRHKDTFIDAYLVYTIKTLIHWYSYYSKIDKSIKNDFYKKLKETFIFLNTNHDINKIKNDIEYNRFMKIINLNLGIYDLSDRLAKIFSVKTGNKHIIYYILGFKLALKK